ncbi:MAG: Ku protein, partial [Paracoccaceae bacterium]
KQDFEGLRMAPRPFWKGYLKLSLVTCPVAMMPATTDNEKVRFHTLNAKTGNRVVSQYIDALTGKPVSEDDEVKGYPRGEDDFVLLEDDELDAVTLESTRTIDIDMFVPADSVGWIWYDTPHYLVPNDAVGEEAFCVIRDAMAASGMVGISRLVLYRRERAVLLEPCHKGIVLWTLRYGDEVRDERDYFGKANGEKPDASLMDLVTKLIDERTVEWTPDMVTDPVQARLLEIIAAKKKGRKRPAKVAAVSEAPRSNVVSIMDALKKSIAAEGNAKRR